MANRGQGGGRHGGARASQSSQIGQPTLEVGPSDPTQVESSIRDEVAVNNAGSCAFRKRGRGKTRGITLTKRRRDGEKLAVDIPPNLMRAVGNNAQALITECGIIVRQMASLQFSKWKTIPDDEKTKMWQATQQKFTLKDEPHIKEAVYQQLNRQYRDYRHKLHKDYYCKYGTDEMRLENPPSCVSTDDWVDLVRYFGSEDFKKMSNRNKENRQKQKIGHVAGMKAFARISYDSRNLETGDEPSRTKLWFTTRYSMKKKVWVDSTSEKVYDELTRLESQPREEGTPPMTEDQRFEAVLGPERSGYIRGRRAGLKPKTSTVGQRIQAQLEREDEEFRRRAEEDTRRLELLEKENSEMASRMESLESQLASQQTQVQAQVQAALQSQAESQQTQVNAQVQAALQSQLNILLQQFKESGQIPM